MYTQPITTHNECKKKWPEKQQQQQNLCYTHTHTTYKLYNDADDWIVSLWKKRKEK